MHRFEADYFDGRSSQRRTVEVTVDGGRALIRGAEVELDLPAADLRVQPRLGRTPQRIVLPDGGVLITHDPVVDQALEVPKATGLAHRLESNLHVVLLSLIGLVLAGWFGYRDGIPWLARQVAMQVPPEVENDIATHGLEELDNYIFKPSRIPLDRQAKLRATFNQLADGGTVPARLEFREGGFIGANAFALPGGVVVMTDQLDATLASDDRVAAVLAHEIGHLEHRHGLRHILQDSITALLAAAVLGDLSSLGSLAATLPALVMHTTNSREFEREADRFAYGVLRKSGRSPRLLGEALTALEAARDSRPESCKVELDEKELAKSDGQKEGGDTGKQRPRTSSRSINLGYLSTHPPTPERVQAAEEAAR